MSLIAGLGNPGRKYAGTRHNIGFELIDRVADVLSITLGPGNGLFQLGKGQFKGNPVQLIKPVTYMNRSGPAVKKAVDLFRPPLDHCLICYDDINLEPGIIRLRPKGSAGGHNGLADIIHSLQTDQIPRLRIGIGNNFDRGRQSNYVLSPFTPEERTIMDDTIDRAAEAVLTFIRTGINKAMNSYN
ncbi:MAG: aminoacyl-tRNA hydrolase [Balneolaceae bacterium]